MPLCIGFRDTFFIYIAGNIQCYAIYNEMGLLNVTILFQYIFTIQFTFRCTLKNIQWLMIVYQIFVAGISSSWSFDVSHFGIEEIFMLFIQQLVLLFIFLPISPPPQSFPFFHLFSFYHSSFNLFKAIFKLLNCCKAWIPTKEWIR